MLVQGALKRTGRLINTAQAFITLKDWSERGSRPPTRRRRDLSAVRDAHLGTAAAADRQSRQFLGLRIARRSGYAARERRRRPTPAPAPQKVDIQGLPPAPQINLVIDREKAGAFGVTFEDINNTIVTSVDTNDFPNRGRMERVIVLTARAA